MLFTSFLKNSEINILVDISITCKVFYIMVNGKLSLFLKIIFYSKCIKNTLRYQLSIHTHITKKNAKLFKKTKQTKYIYITLRQSTTVFTFRFCIDNNFQDNVQQRNKPLVGLIHSTRTDTQITSNKTWCRCIVFENMWWNGYANTTVKHSELPRHSSFSLCFFLSIPEDKRAGLRVRIIQKNTIKDNKRHKNTKRIIDGAPPWPQHSTQQMGRRPWVASCGPDSRGLCRDVVVVVEDPSGRERTEEERERRRDMEGRKEGTNCTVTVLSQAVKWAVWVLVVGADK